MIFTSIEKYIVDAMQSFGSISEERKEVLAKIASFVAVKLRKGEDAKLIYICTHNSRRSHFGQIWSQVAAAYFEVPQVFTFSGGTEATAFHINAIQAIKRIGFEMKDDHAIINPKYSISFGSNFPEIVCFSKTYDHEVNPNIGFCAVMMCSEAEANCPYVAGAEQRVSTTYDDPKVFDNTPEQEAMYDARCRQIAIETLYAFSLLHNN